MEIKEMVIRKRELERFIAERLQLFETEIGVLISDIGMDTVCLDTMEKKDHLIRIIIKVEL